MQTIPLAVIAERLGCTLRGDGGLAISGVAGMEQATPSELTFLANPKYAHKLKHTRAGAVLVSAFVEGARMLLCVSCDSNMDRFLELRMGCSQQYHSF